MTDSFPRFRVGGATILVIALAVVDVGTLAYVMSLDVVEYHTWRAVGDLDAAEAILVLGIALFPLATLLACQRECIRSPRIVDHFRQCLFLYAVLALFLVAIWPGRRTDGGSLAFAISALLASGAVVGLVVNGIMLAVRRAHNHRR